MNDTLFDALNEISDTHLEEAVKHIPKKRLVTWKRLGVAAACVAVIAVSCTVADVYKTASQTNPDENAVNSQGVYACTQSESVASPAGTQDAQAYIQSTFAVEIYSEKAWNERPIYDRYNQITIYNAAVADKTEYNSNRCPIQKEQLGDELEKTVCLGQDIYSDEIYETNCTVYRIKDVTENFAVAVRYEGYDGYYVFLVSDFCGSLKELSLEKNLVFDHAYYYFVEDEGITIQTLNFNENADFSRITETVLNSEKSNLLDIDTNSEFMEISVSIPLLGITNHVLYITENGYVKTNITGTEYIAFIGTQKTAELIDLIKKESTVSDEKTRVPITAPPLIAENAISTPPYDPSGTTIYQSTTRVTATFFVTEPTISSTGDVAAIE